MPIVEKIDTFSEEQIRRFIAIPYQLYKNQPNWVPPLYENIAIYLNREVHPVHTAYNVDFFIATRDGHDIGRIMVMGKRNVAEKHTAQFALFECENDLEAAQSLFDAAISWAKAHNFKNISGPHRLDFTEGDGVLIEGFEYSQIMNMTPYHHNYYANLLERCGFEKELDFTSSHLSAQSFYLPEWLETLAEQLQKKEEIEIKSFSSLEELSQDIPLILQTLQKSLQQNQDLSTANEAQVAFSLQQLFKIGLQPKFIKAIMRKNEMISVILGFPDFSDILRKCHGHFDRDAFYKVVENPEGLVINGFGIVSQFQMQGINALLFREMANMVRSNNIQTVNIVQITETNKKMQSELKSLGIPTTQIHRRYCQEIKEEAPNIKQSSDSTTESFYIPKNVPTTLVDALQNRTQQSCDKQKYIFLQGDNSETQLNFATLNHQAKNIAAQLQKHQSKTALILYPPGLGFIKAFLGCLYANVIAIPCYPITQSTRNRCLAIIKNAQPQIIISDTETRKMAEQRIEDLRASKWLITDEIEETIGWEIPKCDPDSIAMIQYTSGSTTVPKGVVLTHRNLVQNVHLIQHYFGIDTDTPGVSWLPPYHDMGLIGSILTPFYTGMDAIFMSPLDFLRKPVRWLNAISKYKAHVSGGPNFSYDICVDKITPQQCENLDLNTWQAAFNGAEPISQRTMDRFSNTFAAYGFRREAFHACYGLAESTLIVSTGTKSTYPKFHKINNKALSENNTMLQQKTIVSCGKIAGDTKLYIVDPQSHNICGEEQIGEIWISGSCIAKGYWNDDENTQASFGQSIVGIDGAFMRTGDLGFLKDNELFVCGRIKNIIIVHGQNYYPHDIETIAQQSHIAIETGASAAFSIDIDEEPQIVFACELKREHRKADPKEVATAIRAAISTNFQLEVYAVLFVKLGQIPRTTSGKIQHHLCRSTFLDGTLALVDKSIREHSNNNQVDPAKFASLEKNLRTQLAKLLRITEDEINLDQPAADLGLSSLTAVSLISYVEEEYNFEIPIELFFEKTTLKELMVLILNSSTKT